MSLSSFRSPSLADKIEEAERERVLQEKKEEKKKKVVLKSSQKESKLKGKK